MTSLARPDLQWLRALAVVEVVFCHSDLVIKHFSTNSVKTAFYSPIAGIGVEIFFILSGYLICLRAPSYAGWFSFLRSRALRILPLYVIFTALALSARFVNPAWVWNGYELSVLSLLSSFLILPQSWFPIVGVGWSLEHEVIFYELTGLMIATFGLAGRSPVWFGVALMILGWVGMAGNLSPMNGAWYEHPFSVLTIAFGIGWLYRCYEAAGDRAILFVMAVCAACTAALLPLSDTANATAVFRIAGAAAIFLIFVRLRGSITAGGAIDRVVAPIGIAAYSIYLSHWFVLSALGKVLTYSALPSFAVRAAAILLALGIGVAVYACLERPLDLWLRGGRSFREAFAIRRKGVRPFTPASVRETARP